MIKIVVVPSLEPEDIAKHLPVHEQNFVLQRMCSIEVELGRSTVDKQGSRTSTQSSTDGVTDGN